MLDILKNPVIIGLFATAITYGYLLWQLHSEQKRRHKKGRKNTKKEDVNLLIPAIVGIIIWFIAYGYFEYSNNDLNELNDRIQNNITLGEKNYKLVKDDLSSGNTIKSFDLITKGINIPKKPLPDVFIETF
jgi:hypothetical protein